MRLDRRDFLGAAMGGAAAWLFSDCAAHAERTPTDIVPVVPLGKRLQAARVGFGTGMKGWQRESNQTRLGEKEFRNLLSYAYERGVRLFDMADLYGTHSHVAEALQGKDRESYTLVTKIWYHPNGLPEPERPDADVYVARFLKELRTDYIDVVHLHCMMSGDWPKQFRKQMDLLEKLKERGIIRAHGASIHSIAAMKAAAEEPWVDVINARVNLFQQRTDGPMEEVLPALERVHAAGKGVIAMKLNGEGTLDAEQRAKNFRYVAQLKCVDVMIVGFEKPAEIDELLAVVAQAAADSG